MSGHDSLDVLEGIALINLMADPEVYRETEHEGSAAVVEMVALIAGSGTVVSDAGPPGLYDMRAQPDVDGVQQAALRSIDAASMWRLFEAVSDPQPSSGLSFQTVLRETSLRNTSYPHMLRDTLDELFSAPVVIADCQTAIGASPQEIIRVVDALSGVRERRWNERFAKLRKVEELARNRARPRCSQRGS